MSSKNDPSIINEIHRLLSLHKYSEILETYSSTVNSNSAEFWRLLAHAAFKLQNYNSSKVFLLNSVQQADVSPACWHDLGLCLIKLADYNQALTALENSLALRPNYCETLLLYANLLKRTDQLHDACKIYVRILQLQPTHEAAANNLATTYSLLGKFGEAEEIYLQICAAKESTTECNFNYANMLKLIGRTHDAISQYNRCLQKKPLHFEALVNLGSLFVLNGDLEQAQQCFDKAQKIQSTELALLLNWAKLKLARGQTYAAINDLRSARDLYPESVSAHANLCFALNYSDQETSQSVAAHHRALAAKLQGAEHSPLVHLQRAAPRFRVGYISPDLRSHSVAYFIEGILQHHDKCNFETFIYSDSPVFDSISQRLASYSEHWENVAYLSDEKLLALIRGHKLDLLVDLAGLTAGNRAAMLAKRAAPRQLNYLGYPHSTGLPNIDFRIVDTISDPVGSEELASEKLIRLNPCFLNYSRTISLANSVKHEYFTFACFCVLAKISDSCIELWSNILKAAPNSKLYLKSRALDDACSAKLLKDRFARFGVDNAQLILEGHTSDDEEYFACYAKCDLVLDTFPYNGTTTTCEALASGVPVLTLLGDRHAARVGASLLHAIGKEELVAADKNEYLAIAVKLAQNSKEFISLKDSIGPAFRNSPITDSVTFTRHWEGTLKELLG